jgi:hypothetical protein
MRARDSLLFVLVLFCFSVYSHAQLWSGVIAPARATDWSYAGLPGDTLPSSSWTQCGSTIAAYSGTATTINNALAACGTTGGHPNTYILLGSGTFNLSTAIVFNGNNKVELRGAGPSLTHITMSAGMGFCQEQSATICMATTDGSYVNGSNTTYGWTAGYTKGSNSVTLSSAANVHTTASGAPTLLFMEQCDTGYTASSVTSPCTGAAVDNGQLFICQDKYDGTNGCSNDGPGNDDPTRGQLEIGVPTSVAGNVVTLQTPLMHPNWTSGQLPRAWIAQSIYMVGVQGISFDDSGNHTGYFIESWNAYESWIVNCSFSNWSNWAVGSIQTVNSLVAHNYFFNTTGSDSYAIRPVAVSDNIYENNIMVKIFAPIVIDGASSGNVFAYNLSLNDNYANNFMRGAMFEHAVNAYDLYEGNYTQQLVNDSDHGTANFITRYRNFTTGWMSCANNSNCGGGGPKNVATNAIFERSWGRYINEVANVSGTPGYHTQYKTLGSNTAVHQYGTGNGGVTPANPDDPLVNSTSLIWGTYDSVTAAVRWCGNSSDTGWSTTCGSASEVPTGASTYPNSIPTKGDTGAALPASLYLSSKPSWFGTSAWPPIGPDVSGGNVIQCGGTLNTSGNYDGLPALATGATCPAGGAGWSGHVNAIPAMNCYLNVMGGAPDGTGNVLAFNPSACYGASVQQGPTAPTGLSATVQ